MVNLTASPPSLPAPLVYSGKVRDTYDLGGGRLLMIASDRISAFDVTLPSEIPYKGVVLTQLSRFWFEQTAAIAGNHLTGQRLSDLGWDASLIDPLEDRSMIVRAASRVPIECVVRGYLAGSAWAEYRTTGTVSGHALPAGLELAGRLPTPIFTPARKNESGHDENITLDQLRSDIGAELAELLEGTSFALYEFAADLAASRGVIIADTKFEFGLIDGELAVIDELLTPDSSRFWDASSWQPGREPQSWDKQFVRNWLLAFGWDRDPPGPELPDGVVEGTKARYLEGFERITGRSLDEWLAGRRAEARS
jgi:phosphoribosylaminoimidazole-succinocarboxamide synthase